MAHNVDVPELAITPGDWEVKYFPPQMGNSYFVAAPMYEDHPYHKCSRHVDILGDEDYPTKLADAYLTTAAPDLYKALAFMLEGEKDLDLEADYGVEGATIIRAAIAKAQVPSDRAEEQREILIMQGVPDGEMA